MPDSALVNILLSAGTAGAICVCFICGLIFPRAVVRDKDRRIAELEAALAAKDEVNGVAIAAASATRDLMAAIQYGQQLGRAEQQAAGGGHPA